MSDNTLPQGASTDFEACANEIDTGNRVRLLAMPGANTGSEIAFAYRQGADSALGEYVIEWVTPGRPPGMIADIVGEHTKVMPSGVGPSSRYDYYRRREDLMKALAASFRAWIEATDAYDRLWWHWR